MTSPAIATRIARNGLIQSGFGSSTGSRIAQDGRFAYLRGVWGRVRIAFKHSLDEESGDTEANRDACRVLVPNRPLRDVAGEAYGFLPETAHLEFAKGGAPALSTACDRGQRPTSNAERGKPD